jgi:plasmid stability protein
MKTTVELPDALIRAVKIRAVNEGRKLKDVMADVIRHGLAEPSNTAGAPRQKVELPLVACAHEASAADEMTAERVAEVLLRDEARTVKESRDAVR